MDLYKTWKNGEKFTLRALELLFIYLGFGSRIEKSAELFEAYDVDCTSSLERAELEEMFDDLYHIFVEGFVEYSVKVETVEDKRKSLLDYQTLLSSKKDGSKDAFVKLFFAKDTEDKVDKSTFIVNLSTEVNSNLLSTCGFRRFLSGT